MSIPLTHRSRSLLTGMTKHRYTSPPRAGVNGSAIDRVRSGSPILQSPVAALGSGRSAGSPSGAPLLAPSRVGFFSAAGRGEGHFEAPWPGHGSQGGAVPSATAP